MTDMWNKYKEEMKRKRSKEPETKTTSKLNTSQIIQQKSITIQRCSPEVSGRAQKYSKIGAREFVPYFFDEVSIENIKEACNSHFSFIEEDLTCDILAGEQGPSCTLLSQLPNFRVVYIRAISEKIKLVPNIEMDKISDPMSLPLIKKKKTSKDIRQQQPCLEINYPIPKSLSVMEMIKLGNVYEATNTKLKISDFNILKLMWTSEIEIDIKMEKNNFSEGGFRKAYKVQSSSNILPGTWVLKKYLPETLGALKATNQTPEEHTRKIVQMHMLATNFAAQLAKTAQALSNKQFGYVPKYTRIYFGKLLNDGDWEFVTIEEYIEGSFKKYISNDGKKCGDTNAVAFQKAACLAHFSYSHSDQQLLLTDLQGGILTYTDPEIASLNPINDDGSTHFCAGNIGPTAITNFIADHECNDYCKLLDLKM